MKKVLNILMILFFLTANYLEIIPAPFDTGMTTLEQPNRVTFTGRIWGDEFFFWAETEASYRFVQSGDGYFYYAQLD